MRFLYFGLLSLALINCSTDNNIQNKTLNSTDRLEIHVDSTGVCAGNTPCLNNIQDAIDYSFSSQFEYSDFSLVTLRPDAPADTILVWPGEYVANWIEIGDDHAFIQHSYTYDGIWKLEIKSINGPDNTVIYSDNNGPCFETSNDVNVKIVGFTFTQCSDSNYGHTTNKFTAVHIGSYSNARILVKSNIFRNNYSNGPAVHVSPGPINIENVDIAIVGNTIHDNTSGIFIDGIDNEISLGESHIRVAQNIIFNNHDDNAFDYYNGVGILVEYVSTGNHVKVDIFHNTLTNNITGIDVAGSEGIIVANNISHGNTIDMALRPYLPFPNSQTTSIIHNNYMGSGNVDLTTLNPDNINYLGDPGFTNPAQGDFSLSNNSPAIDAGILLDVNNNSEDYYGYSRIVDGNFDEVALPDIGAIEYLP